MLTKSRKSAAIMAAIVLVAATGVYLVGQDLVSPSSLLDAVSRPELFSAAEFAIGALILLTFVVVCVGLGAWLIYPLDESNFGFQAAVRWLLVGILLGLALHGLGLLLPASSSAGEETGSPLVRAFWRTLRLFLAPIALYLSYWLIFRLPAKLRKQGAKNG
jgi:hypothetical protein